MSLIPIFIGLTSLACSFIWELYLALLAALEHLVGKKKKKEQSLGHGCEMGWDGQTGKVFFYCQYGSTLGT
jgi:hypothetical protein